MGKLQEQDIKHTLYKPPIDSHKGENGRLLVIGGSTLFHASIFWSADVASRVVDLVHFTSPANENNDLVRQKLKSGFWNGIVVPFERVGEYIEEDDCVLIGPGMSRDEGLAAGEKPSSEIVNTLVAKYPHKRWVIDGGALQEIDVNVLTNSMIITPHHKEWEKITYISNVKANNLRTGDQLNQVKEFSIQHHNVTVLLKGKEDIVCRGDEAVIVPGGNAGMTKGGTGDVLAGLVAALYCKNEAFHSARIASVVMKRAGEELGNRVGNYFNAGDLLPVVPEVLARVTE
ncbi:NAD(P)H-hydrate dehydratase [Microgenomates group bacterium RIFCSPLOWO2_01_FULL_47_10]|nr:MAG: NAD(P)H-hydrate dehydratase [Microgenomates group bacterium RIFCSPLOWO2_01_FULL_47_10]